MKEGARLDAAVSASDLLAAFPDPTILVGSRGRVVAANRGAEAVFGYRRNELAGRRLDALVPLRFRASHDGLHRAYTAHPVARAMGAGLELVGRRKDGTEFPAEISVSPLRSRGETLFVAAVRDLTRR